MEKYFLGKTKVGKIFEKYFLGKTKVGNKFREKTKVEKIFSRDNESWKNIFARKQKK